MRWRRRERKPPEARPDEPVEIAQVPLMNAPMLVTRLRAAGIDAEMLEAVNVATRSTTDARIFVPRSQVAAAERLL